MPSSNDSTFPTRAGLGDSLRQAYLSTLESCPGERTRRALALYDLGQEKLPASIGRRPLSPPDLVAGFICLSLLLLALAFAFIPLTLWATPAEDTDASSTDAWRWERGWDGWTNRKLYCSLQPQCADSSPVIWEGRFSLRYEPEVVEPELREI